MNELNKNTDIGGFTLSIGGKEFAVVYFQLQKAVGTFSSCTVAISDYTQQVSFNNSSYPKTLGSIKEVFNNTQDYQNIGTLLDVTLKEYKRTGGTKTWFIGKLCTVTPLLQATYGVSASLSCFCLGQACMLMYSPASDFVYVPATKANDLNAIQSAGVFSGTISQAQYAASQKADLITCLLKSEATTKDTILQMLNKTLATLTSMKGKRGAALGQQPKIPLDKYFDCNIKLSDVVAGQLSKTINPYISSLIQDFFNGFNNATVYQAITQTLRSRDRCLTVIPPSIQDAQKGYDKLRIWPQYIEPLTKGVVLKPDQMLSCNINSNPMQQLRTPTCLYIRAKKMSAFSAQVNQKPQYWMSKGRYILKGAKAPYRLQVLDVPSWALNAIVQRLQKEQSKGSEKTVANKAGKSKFTNKDTPQEAAAQKETSKQTSVSINQWQNLLNQLAKTKFFNTYMLNKQAFLRLAVTDETLLFDKNVGKSIQFQMPVEAAQLGKQGLKFYGRVQQVRYTFKASSSPKNKSSMQITCTLSGVTYANAPASIVYKDDGQLPIYKRG